MQVEQERRPVAPREDSAEKLHVEREIRKTPLMHEVELQFGMPIKELFDEIYLRQGGSFQDIARMIGRSWSTAYSWAHKLGITIRSSREAVGVYWGDPERRRVRQIKFSQVRNALGAETDKDLGAYLTALYLQEGSQRKVAERIREELDIGVSGTTMRRWMNDLGIEVEKRGIIRWLREEEIRNAVKLAFASGAFSGLSNRERVVLNLRCVAEKTLEKCAEELGVTRERIRQIEEKALGKLGIRN